jgi:pyruvate,water dikinase
MSDEDPSEARKAARAVVRERLPFFQRRAFDRLLESEIAYIGLREQVSDATSQGIYQMHRILVALAGVLVRRGNLADPGDLFYLTYPEVYDLIAGELTSGAAQARCASRRVEMAEDAKLDLPPIIFGDRVPTTAVRLPADQEYLTGIGGSSGRAQGVARVILTPAQAPADLGPNDILVVPFTDVGWTPLFPGIGGIVAETGGRLSHTSIVAREYGLPAVVSVHQATHMLQNGQPITIDGNTGRVYFGLAPAA